MDTGIDAVIKVYSQEELKETAEDVSLDLEENIKNELYPPDHGYDTGELQGSIRGNIQIITDDYALVTGTYTAPHGIFVLMGVRGILSVDPIDFLGDGLEKTLANYG